MAPVRLFAAALLLTAAPASAQTDRWDGLIGEAAARFGLPESWIRRVMAAESGGRTEIAGQPITSAAGAMGLMQLMPAAWTDMRRILGLGANPYDPHDNILAGTAYLRAMYDRFGYPGLFGAYNAGPGRYSAHLATGQPLPRETLDYLSKVTGGGDAVKRPSLVLSQSSPEEKDVLILAASRFAGTRARSPRDPLFVIRYTRN